MEVSAQALIDVLTNQRNIAMDNLAQTHAALNTAMAEIGRLTEELAKATAQPVEGND